MHGACRISIIVFLSVVDLRNYSCIALHVASYAIFLLKKG